MRKSAKKQQSQVQTIQKTVTSRNVSQVDDNINSGKAVTGFVVVAWGPLRMSSTSHNTAVCSSIKHYDAIYTALHCAAVCGTIQHFGGVYSTLQQF